MVLRAPLSAASIMVVTAMSACGGRTDLDLLSSSVSSSAGSGNAGGMSARGGNASGGNASAPAACPVCSYQWFDCAAPGFESVVFQVQSRDATGCGGYVYAYPGAPVAIAGPYIIGCEPGQVCIGQECYPAEVTATSFLWSTVTCSARIM